MISRPEKWKGLSGRVTEHLEGLEQASQVYICGNGDMVKTVKEMMKPKELKNRICILNSLLPYENSLIVLSDALPLQLCPAAPVEENTQPYSNGIINFQSVTLKTILIV